MPLMIHKDNVPVVGSEIQTTKEVNNGIWNPYIARHTTGQFSKVDRGYKRHCGPTAITNLLLTLQKKHPVPALYGLAPELLFHEVAALGRHIFAYYNIDLWIFGGTTMLMTDLYIRMALKKYGIKNVRVIPHLFGFASRQRKKLLKCLDEGALVYLQLLRHHKYGSHHLLVSGYEIDHSAKDGPVIKLILADGWSSEVRTLAIKDTKRISFWEIKEK